MCVWVCVWVWVWVCGCVRERGCKGWGLQKKQNGYRATCELHAALVAWGLKLLATEALSY